MLRAMANRNEIISALITLGESTVEDIQTAATELRDGKLTRRDFTTTARAVGKIALWVGLVGSFALGVYQTRNVDQELEQLLVEIRSRAGTPTE